MNMGYYDSMAYHQHHHEADILSQSKDILLGVLGQLPFKIINHRPMLCNTSDCSCQAEPKDRASMAHSPSSKNKDRIPV